MSNNTHNDPVAGIGFDGNAEMLYSYLRADMILIMESDILLWANWPKNIINLLQCKLNSDQEAKDSVDHFEGEDKQLFEFTKCRYGAMNSSPDIINGKLSDEMEYFDCGFRGKCQYEGKRCKPVIGPNGYLRVREIEIIKLIAKGLRNDQIADKLFISEHTVRTHIQNIRFKLAVNSKAGITAFAYKKQLIQV